MTKRASFYLCAALAAAAIAACDAKATDAPATAEPTASEAPSAEPQASGEPEPSAAESAEPEASAATSAPAPKASTAPAGNLDAKALAEKWGCGGKGQKACPMQGWMKGAMPSAVQSGDKDKLARALDTVASKPVAGYSQWSGIAAAGAAKARAGDIEGAKQACKKCHSLYQEKYKQTMRNAPW
ncbi:MAG TPA: hypothetical protein VFB62_13175 [Polyangiaceae bacterium]|jgi:hypothetical protein|nr:hypothetical protein [Polyangiaceae bacterium]